MVSGLDLVRLGDDRLRIGPWRGSRDVAYVAPIPEGHAPTSNAVRRLLDVLVGRGYREVVTAALRQNDAQVFLRAGFTIREHLHLLTHDLEHLPEAGRVRLRRARHSDRADVLELDNKAFQPFWQLDNEGLDEAINATRNARFRVAGGSPVIGYAVSGRSGRHGYLQRLAVAPDHQGRGVGSALVVDALSWMRKWGVTQASVNTQEDNAGALRLYEHLGFRRQVPGLAVLKATLQ